MATKFELAVDLRPRSLSFDDGWGQLTQLLRELGSWSEFAAGWGLDGAEIADDEPLVKGRVMDEIGAEGLESGLYFAVLENGRTARGQAVPPEQYLANYSFGDGPSAGHLLRLSFAETLASVDLFRRCTQAILDWQPAQHMAIQHRGYLQWGSPIDLRRRRGFGWVGWVPFEILDDQVPEAEIVERMGSGTFVALQTAPWNSEDPDTVERTQALELRLNGLGVLPSKAELLTGSWGQ